MSTDEQIKSLIERIKRLEKAVFKSGAAWEQREENVGTKTLADHIRDLRDQKDFFKSTKTQNEVHEALRSAYECEPKRVGVELIRLHKKKELRKASKIVKGKKFVAYVK